MSQIEARTQTVTAIWQRMYAPIADEMHRVESLLRNEMRSDYPYVDQLVRYGTLLGGKRLRPALLLLSGRVFSAVTDEQILLAAVVEMIHTATLVHDDVLDDAAVRRYRATVNSRWDSEASVLLGDFLFTHAFYLASTLNSTRACRWIGRTTNIVCEGEIRQKGTRGQFSIDEPDYLKILDAKTAELCACCCRLGASYAGADEIQVDHMAEFGRNLGIAFQIADDLLDLGGDEAQVGKSLGTDLAKQKPTLPVIFALRMAPEAERRQLIEMLEHPAGGTVAQLRVVLERCDAMTYSRNQAIQFAEAACQHLETLPDSPARATLMEMARFVVERNH